MQESHEYLGNIASFVVGYFSMCANHLSADLIFQGDSDHYVFKSHWELLSAIEETGSISQAAKLIGISYKTAWNRVEELNQLSKIPLVQKITGGNKGGGASLSAFGKDCLNGYRKLQNYHRDFLSEIAKPFESLNDIAKLGSKNETLLRTKNQFQGKVLSFIPGDSYVEVNLKIGNDLSIVSIVNHHLANSLAIQIGADLLVSIDSAWIILSREFQENTSVRNQLMGKVHQFESDQVNCELCLSLNLDTFLYTLITNKSLKKLNLKVGETIYALFKAQNVQLQSLLA